MVESSEAEYTLFCESDIITDVTTFVCPLKVILGSASSKAPLKYNKVGQNLLLAPPLFFSYFFPSLPASRFKFQIFTVPSSDPEAAIISFGWKQTVLTESRCLKSYG